MKNCFSLAIMRKQILAAQNEGGAGHMGHAHAGGCPKLDEGDYTEKLTQIISNNSIKSITIVRMEVPCCGGLEHAATEALKASGKF